MPKLFAAFALEEVIIRTGTINDVISLDNFILLIILFLTFKWYLNFSLKCNFKVTTNKQKKLKTFSPSFSNEGDFASAVFHRACAIGGSGRRGDKRGDA
jgi:hypothetical protein